MTEKRASREFGSRLAWVAAILAIIAVGAYLRFRDLGQIPPGLHFDEAANGMDGLNVWKGQLYRLPFHTHPGGRSGVGLAQAAGAPALARGRGRHRNGGCAALLDHPERSSWRAVLVLVDVAVSFRDYQRWESARETYEQYDADMAVLAGEIAANQAITYLIPLSPAWEAEWVKYWTMEYLGNEPSNYIVLHPLSSAPSSIRSRW